MVPPRANKRFILDYDGEGLLREAIELMRRAAEILDTVCNEHLVVDWVVTREK